MKQRLWEKKDGEDRFSREKGEQNFLSNPSERKWRGLCEKFGLKSLNSPSGAITIIPLVLNALKLSLTGNSSYLKSGILHVLPPISNIRKILFLSSLNN